MEHLCNSLGKAKTINGVHFESADEALERLQDYGCLHFKTPIICGISEPTYSPSELARLNEQNNRTYNINGKEMTGYEATQAMRRLESAIREQKGIKAAAMAEGNMVPTVKDCDARIKAYQAKYNEISDITGIAKDPKRMSVPKSGKLLTSGGNSSKIKIGANEAVRNTGTRLKYNENASFKMEMEGYSQEVNTGLSNACKDVAKLGSKDGNEHMHLVDLETGESKYTEIGEELSVGFEMWEFLEKHPERNFAFVHNHNTDGYFSETDISTLLTTKNIKLFVATRLDGVIYATEKTQTISGYTFLNLYKDEIEKINKKSRERLIGASERTKLREETIVDNALRDYTKGLKEFV